MKIGSIENHREREKGVVVYPVYSRRSQGLSMGINLFPDHKYCSFDCPYCEVFPFETNTVFSLENMETNLRHELKLAQEQNIAVKDISFAGNGEPVISPYFIEAVEAAVKIRDEAAPEADIVVITNGTGLLKRRIFDFLRHAAAGHHALKIWLKLDAGTESWYKEMNRSEIGFEKLLDTIKEFARYAPFTIQTMLCTIKGEAPSAEEAAAWEKLVAELAEISAEARKKAHQTDMLLGIHTVQIYSKARPSPEDPLVEALPLSYLNARAASLNKTLKDKGLDSSEYPIAIQVFL